MKNELQWKPSKFILIDGILKANPDSQFVAISSRLNVNLLGKALESMISKFASGRLLDLGCGRVPLYEKYRSKCTEIVCIDWGNSPHDISHIDIEADLNLPIPIESKYFDSILFTDVLEHIAEPEKLLSEARRMLRDGGVLIGTVPFLYRLHEEPHDYCRYTIHKLQRLALLSNFTVDFLEPYGQGTDVLFDVLGKIIQPLHWRFGPLLANWTQKFGLIFRSSVFGVKCNKYNKNMPLGYAFVFRAA